MPVPEKVYFFNSSERGLSVEIYFPKRAAYYGAIFKSLRKGHDEALVKRYLQEDVEKLINEFQAFPDLFKPSRQSSAALCLRWTKPLKGLKCINLPSGVGQPTPLTAYGLTKVKFQ